MDSERKAYEFKRRKTFFISLKLKENTEEEKYKREYEKYKSNKRGMDDPKSF